MMTVSARVIAMMVVLAAVVWMMMRSAIVCVRMACAWTIAVILTNVVMKEKWNALGQVLRQTVLLTLQSPLVHIH